MPKKAGYLTIVGKPNAGKSTLMNAILGTKLSIVTQKQQTTRKPVLGIYTKDDCQIVFTDTPGILKPKYEMQRSMVSYIFTAIEDADIIAVIYDVVKFRYDGDHFPKDFIEAIRKSGKPIFLLLNKIDLINNVKEVLPIIESFSKLGFFNEIIPISALKHASIDTFIKTAEKYLPESEFYFDPEDLSTQSERFFVSELIREIVFKEYHEEIPYSTEINIPEFKEREEGKWYISAEIIIERKSQKPIIIGAKGEKLKRVGERSRKAIEEHLQKEIYLELFVKVRDKWRNNKTLLKSYGY
jgi:GTP-binding protein Era